MAKVKTEKVGRKLKAKTVSVLVAGGILFGGVTGYATASNYYGDLLYAQKDDISERTMAKYDELYNERSRQVHADLVIYVEERKQAAEGILEDYVRTKVNEGAEHRQAEHAQAVDEAYERILAEVKAEVDARITEELGEVN